MIERSRIRVPAGAAGEFSSARVKFLCWLVFRYPLHPRVTAVARHKIPVILPKVQVAGYRYWDTYTLPMWIWMKWHCNLVHGWMVSELALKRQHFTWHQPCNTQRNAISTPLPWILIIRAIKGYSHSFRITCQCAQWVCLRAENSVIERKEKEEAMNNNNCYQLVRWKLLPLLEVRICTIWWGNNLPFGTVRTVTTLWGEKCYHLVRWEWLPFQVRTVTIYWVRVIL